MKSVLAAFALLALSLPASASYLRINYSCESVSIQGMKMEIETLNRPDFEIESFNSTKDTDGVEFRVSNDGEVISAAAKTLTYKEGVSTPLTDKNAQGEECVYGSKVEGSVLSARMQYRRTVRDVTFTCTEMIFAPHGGDCN